MRRRVRCSGNRRNLWGGVSHLVRHGGERRQLDAVRSSEHHAHVRWEALQEELTEQRVVRATSGAEELLQTAKELGRLAVAEILRLLN